MVDNSLAFQPGSVTKLADSYRSLLVLHLRAHPLDECGNTEPASAVYDFATLYTIGLLNCDALPAQGLPNYFDRCAMAVKCFFFSFPRSGQLADTSFFHFSSRQSTTLNLAFGTSTMIPDPSLCPFF